MQPLGLRGRRPSEQTTHSQRQLTSPIDVSGGGYQGFHFPQISSPIMSPTHTEMTLRTLSPAHRLDPHYAFPSGAPVGAAPPARERRQSHRLSTHYATPLAPSALECVLQRVLDQPTDTNATRGRKRLGLAVHVALILLTAAALVRKRTSGMEGAHEAAAWFILGVAVLSLARLLATRTLPVHLVEALVYACMLGFFAIDAAETAALRPAAWPLCVVGVEVIRAAGAPPLRTYVALGIVVTWLVLMQLERVYRFGLLDAWGMPGIDARVAPAVACGAPPCGDSLRDAVFSIVSGLVLIACHYLLGSYYCVAASSDAIVAEDTLAAVNDIIASACAFDIATAELLLDQALSIPRVSRNELHGLLSTMRTCRAYMPDSLFRLTHAQQAAPTYVQHPPPVDGDVTIVFTDVRDSTMTWEDVPQAMRAALRRHDAIIRKWISQCRGYEVKTIGDAFMVAFPSVQEGVSFGLNVLADLDAEVWPDELAAVPRRAHDEKLGLGLLCVRVGLNFGPVDIEVNEVTGRVDYFGPTVNRAARVEAKGAPGAVNVAKDLGGEPSVDLSRVVCVRSDDNISLKGIKNLTSITALFPKSLRMVDARTETVLAFWKDGDVSLPPPPPADTSTDVPHTWSVGSDGAGAGEDASIGGVSHATVAPMSMKCHDGASLPSRISMAVRKPPPEVASTVLSSRPTSAAVMKCFDTPSATIGTVLLQLEGKSYRNAADIFDFANFALERIVLRLTRTQGHVLTVFGSFVYIGWNTTSPCASHIDQALRFLTLKSDNEPPDFTGLGSGKVYTGAVGTGEQNFIVSLGSCAQLSTRLCLYGVERGYSMLCASHGPDSFAGRPEFKHCLKQVCTWEMVSGRSSAYLDVYCMESARGIGTVPSPMSRGAQSRRQSFATEGPVSPMSARKERTSRSSSDRPGSNTGSIGAQIGSDVNVVSVHVSSGAPSIATQRGMPRCRSDGDALYCDNETEHGADRMRASSPSSNKTSRTTPTPAMPQMAVAGAEPPSAVVTPTPAGGGGGTAATPLVHSSSASALANSGSGISGSGPRPRRASYTNPPVYEPYQGSVGSRGGGARPTPSQGHGQGQSPAGSSRLVYRDFGPSIAMSPSLTFRASHRLPLFAPNDTPKLLSFARSLLAPSSLSPTTSPRHWLNAPQPAETAAGGFRRRSRLSTLSGASQRTGSLTSQTDSAVNLEGESWMACGDRSSHWTEVTGERGSSHHETVSHGIAVEVSEDSSTTSVSHHAAPLAMPPLPSNLLFNRNTWNGRRPGQ